MESLVQRSTLAAAGAIERDVHGMLLWAGLGASVGGMAAHRRGFSLATGVIAGLVLGPLAVVLFFVPVWGSDPVRAQKCPYCAGRVSSDARVCHHCDAILEAGWG